jgi:hypothetical protein
MSVALRFALAPVSIAFALGLARVFIYFHWPQPFYRIGSMRNRDHFLVRFHAIRHFRNSEYSTPIVIES